LASVLGIGLGLLLLNYFIYTVFPTAMPEIGVTVDVSLKTVISSLILGIVAVGIAPLLTISKLLKTNIPSTLRIIE
jgi:putative ABC transport system permease protein